MLATFDAGMLSILIHPTATIPDDPLTGKALMLAKERIEYLVETLEQSRSTIILPTPAVAEFLVVVDEAGISYLRLLGTYSTFDIQPFDLRAAIECAESQRRAFAAGDKKSGAEGTFQKSKVDRQIVSVAKALAADVIYTTDKDVVNIAAFMGIKCVPIWKLPLPPPPGDPDQPDAEADTSLPLEGDLFGPDQR
jgi:hypothetical protein